MKFFPTSFRSTLFKAVLLGCVAAAPIAMSVGAHAAVTDPFQILYVFSGARDTGGGNLTGVATVIHCSNIAGTTENLQIVALNFPGNPVANATITISSGQTRSITTHDTALFAEDLFLNSAGNFNLNQGVIVVLGTNTNFSCTGMIVDATTATPNGINLHALRFNPHPLTQN